MTNAEATITENAPTVAEPGAHVAQRAESKGAKILGLIRRPKGATLGRDRESHGLAETFDPGLPRDRRQEARSEDRAHEDRGRRSRIPDQK